MRKTSSVIGAKIRPQLYQSLFIEVMGVEKFFLLVNGGG